MWYRTGVIRGKRGMGEIWGEVCIYLNYSETFLLKKNLIRILVGFLFIYCHFP